MTRLFCVTVVAILAARVLMEVMYHSSMFILYCHLQKERGSLPELTLSMERYWVVWGQSTNRPQYLLCLPVFPGGLGWETGERKVRLAWP